MNKKIIIISLAVLGILILGLITWLYAQNRQVNEPVINPIINSTSTPTTALPVVTKPKNSVAITTDSMKNSFEEKEDVFADTFEWVRIIFLNENNSSKRLQSYFERTDFDQKIILDKCDLVREPSCLTDFKAVAKICKLSDDGLSSLPFAFDRSTELCYIGYTEVVAYLNAELDQINKRKQ